MSLAEEDGSWELPKTVQSPSLFLHRFSPLLHVLDLDTDLLGREGASLIDSCNRALHSARNELSKQEPALQKGLKDPQVLDLKGLVNSVVVSLSLSATISDRVKDLYSDSILRHRGAIVGHADQTTADIPDSLSFRSNIEAGVIKPWLDHTSSRPGAILVYGPPGTGKTTVAAIIASELNVRSEASIGTDRWRFLTLSPADFARKGSDGIVACAEQLFRELRGVRRCVVLLDEMEEFLRARGPGSDRDSRLVTTAFLPLLQEAVNAREVILVVATNFVGTIDAAVTRPGRFDLILPLGPPDPDARRKILSLIQNFQRMIKFLHPEIKFSGATVLPEKSLEESAFAEAIVKYSMGYSRAELLSFFHDLWVKVEPEVANRKARVVLANSHKLEVELWRIRAERVPVALSGPPGSDWRTFEDEVRRHHRYAQPHEPKANDKSYQEYWREPAFPLRPK